MRTFEFSIIASGLDHTSEDFETRFHEAGCDDATVSYQKGHIILDFAREAESIEDAIASAVENVVDAGAIVDRVEPDPLVSLAEIAARTGLTRAALTNYAKGSRAKGFPAPVARVTTDSPLWDWSEVAVWLYRRKKISRDAALAAIAVTAANEVLHSGKKRLGRQLHQRVKDSEASLEAA